LRRCWRIWKPVRRSVRCWGAFWAAVVLDTDPPRCGLASTLHGETYEAGPLVPPGGFSAECAGEVLPQANVVALTGTSLINHTFDDLISLCCPDAFVILLGASAPLSPVLFDYCVDAVAGTRVVNVPAVLQAVGQGATFRQIPDRRLLTMMRGEPEWMPSQDPCCLPSYDKERFWHETCTLTHRANGWAEDNDVIVSRRRKNDREKTGF
jgi:hypothetical protein